MSIDKYKFVTIKWFPWYFINMLWEIKWKRGRILKPIKDIHWYCIVTLHKDWKQYTKYVHRLVAENFIKNKNKLEQINHKDWNKTNNDVQNLERCDRWYNQKHKYRVLWCKPSIHWEKEVVYCDIEWNIIWMFKSISEASRYTWIDISQISWCCIWRKGYNTAWWYKRYFKK